MLSNLFNPAWKSGSVEKRLKAISAMDSASAANQKILSQLAFADEDVSVCIAAIGKLTAATELHELSIKHGNDLIRAEAANRLNTLMTISGSLTKGQYDELLTSYPELELRIAAHADLASVRADIMQNLPENQLIEILALTVYTDSRQQIADRLTELETLEAARKILRGKDKKAERILKTKIDEFRRQQREQAENLAMAEKLCEEAEYLASHDWRAEFKARLQVNRERWEKLDFQIEPDTMLRYQSARQIIDARFDELTRIEQTRQSQLQLLAEIEAFLRDIAGRDLSRSIETLAETLLKRDQFSASWQQLADTVSPDLVTQDKVEKMFEALLSSSQLVNEAAAILHEEDFVTDDETAISRQDRTTKEIVEKSQPLKTALTKLKWPAVYGELLLATQLQTQLSDWDNAQKSSAAEHQEKLDGLHKKINSIFRFSRAGNLNRAKQACERVEKALKQFEGKERVILEDRFEEARKTLGDMGDWKDFATEPKYIELCEAMESLASSKAHPDKRSNAMKDLQQRWKKLGHSDITESYWPRFKLAADKVYQPCAEFFDERHKTRKIHLEQRQQYVEQMRELYDTTDWDNEPDYKAVQSAVRSISGGFTSIKDIDPRAGEKQWQQFSKIKKAVTSKIDAVCEANIVLKQQLIEQTRALAEASAKDENLHALKSLQTRWKQIGTTQRKQDQKAWDEFKKLGDAVFNNVQELRQQKRQESDQQANAYRQIIKDIQALAKTATNLAEADQLFAVLQANHAELPELQPADSGLTDPHRAESYRPETRKPKANGPLPEKIAEGIQRDYQKACDQFDQCRSRIINSKHSQQIESLRQKADLCAQLEALGVLPDDEKHQQISQQWDAIELHDAVLSSRIEQRRTAAQQDMDRAAISAERRMLCIQLEILMGVDSPQEDKTLRMQYQLEQMNNSGLGQQSVKSQELLESMEVDWLCMPGAEPSQQKELDERFWSVLRSA